MRCLGYRHNTGCKKISKNPYAHNWTEWQLCFDCAETIHPEHYISRQRRGKGGKCLKQLDTESMITIE